MSKHSKYSKNDMNMLYLVIFLLLVNLGMNIYSMYSQENKKTEKYGSLCELLDWGLNPACPT